MNSRLIALAICSLVIIIDANACGVSNSYPEKITNSKLENNAILLDSSKIKAINFVAGSGFVAFDENDEKLFEIFPFDNGPDYPSDNLFRIVKDGKIGFADLRGNIIIEPQFSAALPFQNGFAAFCTQGMEIADGEHKIWSGGKWGFIDSLGTIKIPAIYDKIISQFERRNCVVEYSGSAIQINKKGEVVKMESSQHNPWINLLGSATNLVAKILWEDEITIDLIWQNNDKYIFSADSNSEYLEIKIYNTENREILEYDIIPWTNFTVKKGSEFLISIDELVTVTDYAIIYATLKPKEKNKNDVRFN